MFWSIASYCLGEMGEIGDDSWHWMQLDDIDSNDSLAVVADVADHSHHTALR